MVNNNGSLRIVPNQKFYRDFIIFNHFANYYKILIAPEFLGKIYGM
jgi:hypothetical protein